MVSPQTAILCKPDTRETQLGFSQPVSTARLVPFDLMDLEQPVDSDRELCIELFTGGQWKPARVVAQSATGALRL
eukprot:4259427-Pyramimonas_sp.AAC.1